MLSHWPFEGLEPYYMDVRDVFQARLRYLIVGTVSYGFFGLYISAFALAIWSSSETKASGSVTTRRWIMWIVWVTACLVVIRQVLNTFPLSDDLCPWSPELWLGPWPSVNTDPKPSPWAQGCDYDAYVAINSAAVSQMANLYMPPLIALLADGVLAWRVYVIWNQPTWLRYALGTALSVNCAMGLVVAIEDTRSRVLRDFGISHYHTFPSLYIAWAWVAFGLNSILSVSMLVRIRGLGDMPRQGLGRYAIVMRALVESAALSWVGTLTCAVAWSIGPHSLKPPENSDTAPNSVLDSFTVYVDTPFRIFSSVMTIGLPYLLAISQVLIIARVNLSKFQTPLDFAETITGPPGSWDDTDSMQLLTPNWEQGHSAVHIKPRDDD